MYQVCIHPDPVPGTSVTRGTGQSGFCPHRAYSLVGRRGGCTSFILSNGGKCPVLWDAVGVTDEPDLKGEEEVDG